MNASTAIDAGSSSACRIDVIRFSRRVAISSSAKRGCRATSAASDEHVVEIFGQAGRGDRHLVAAGRDRQRRAAPVEIVGDRFRRSGHGSAIEHARAQRRGAVAIERIGVRAGAHADQHADRRRRVIRLREDGDAVVEDARGRWDSAGTGSNQPIVRFDGVRYFAAAACTCSTVTASSRLRSA